MAKLLVIEDDETLLGSVKQWLQGERHTVDAVTCVRDGLDRVMHYQFDMLILDWELPDGSGLDILTSYRGKGGQAPVLMLTGKSNVNDKRLGLDSGADDYLTKPFDLIELGARVRALLRRGQSELKSVLSVGPVTLDPARGTVKRGETTLHLPPKEFAVLELLMKHPGEYFTVESISARVWSDEADISPESIRTYINRLRNRINDPAGEPLIKTQWKRGYSFEV